MAWLCANCHAIRLLKAGIYLFTHRFRDNSDLFAQKSLPPAEVCSGKTKPGLDSFAQIHKSADVPGEARQSGNPLSAAVSGFLSR
jgi:hypothetical protein